MADHGQVEYATAQGNDLPAHVAMYDRFVHLIVVGGAHVANIVLGLAIGGVVDLYHGLLRADADLIVRAYETWGFKRLNRELIDALNIWARFIYGPLLDDRVRSLADGVKPAEYGRREAFRVHQALKQRGPVTVPREFVFMDRAAIGLGAVFLHLRAELNFHKLFNEAIEDFSIRRVGERQTAALAAVGLDKSASER